jgi:hypothetical protein
MKRLNHRKKNLLTRKFHDWFFYSFNQNGNSTIKWIPYAISIYPDFFFRYFFLSQPNLKWFPHWDHSLSRFFVVIWIPKNIIETEMSIHQWFQMHSGKWNQELIASPWVCVVDYRVVFYCHGICLIGRVVWLRMGFFWDPFWGLQGYFYFIFVDWVGVKAGLPRIFLKNSLEFLKLPLRFVFLN